MAAITGIGIDVVDIGRFQESLERTAALRRRLFTEAESVMKISSLAARFAAKEALAKALNAKTATFNWQEVEIINEASGKPAFIFSGEISRKLADSIVHLSLSHDAGIASAMVIVEARA
ncbi:MAG: holo-ACP synthase [Actinomycetes bacterium]